VWDENLDLDEKVWVLIEKLAQTTSNRRAVIDPLREEAKELIKIKGE